jgi:LacI family transcriptional regulator
VNAEQPASGTATLEDVARSAGVSLATASRVLNGSSRKVAEPYRVRVLQAAEELSYSANLVAQAVARGATQTVALVVADITDPYFSAIASGVLKAARDLGIIVTLAVTERSSEREVELARVLRGQRPRGIVLAGSRIADDRHEPALIAELKRFQQSGGRVTVISQARLPFQTVEIRNAAGAAALAEELHHIGYRQAAVLTGPGNLLTAAERTRGFTEHFAELGAPVPPRRLVVGEFTRDGGFLAAAELHRRGLGQVDCVFAVNDVMAVGAMAYLRSAGVAMPTDLAIAGFDDIPGLRDITPALTTVSLPLEQIGRDALVHTLGADPAGPLPTFQGSVLIRESTPPI